MKVFFRKVKSGFIRLGMVFSAIWFFIKKVCAVIKCCWLYIFSCEKKTFVADAEKTLNELKPDKGFLIDGINFKNDATIDLSIIIATYNTEKYIKECLDSILTQNTAYDYEIIIVNDGSTDDTASVIKPYLKDSKVKYFEQQNAGQSAARNFAISESKGKYIMIVDSDDVLADGSIDFLMKAAINNGCDIAEGKGQFFYDNFTPACCGDNVNVVYPDKKLILTSKGYSWAKIYKRELWENVSFPVGYIFEDVITKFILRRKCDKIALSEKIVYGYRVNSDSSSHNGNDFKFLDALRVLPKIWELCERNEIPKDKVFYLLSLNHIGLLNYVMVKSKDETVKAAAFSVMQKQLKMIDGFKPHCPIMFNLLRKSIIKGKINLWQTIAKTIINYRLIKKYREIN